MSHQSFEELCNLFGYTPKGQPLTSEEVADLLRVHTSTLAAYRLRGDGPRYFSPPGTRRVWYAERDILQWMASGAKRSTSEPVAA